MPNQNPEQKARDTIDAMLRAAGWSVQEKSKIDFNACGGQAVREYLTDSGPADYVLFVDRKPVGVIEAKKETLGQNITTVEDPSKDYISELRRDPRRMHPAVERWQRDVGDVWLSVITLNEVLNGLCMMERKDPAFATIPAAWYAQIIDHSTRFRILNVDCPIAELAANFRAAHGTAVGDSLIAATAKIYGPTVATRNTSHFEACGIDIFYPWDDEA